MRRSSFVSTFLVEAPMSKSELRIVIEGDEKDHAKMQQMVISKLFAKDFAETRYKASFTLVTLQAFGVLLGLLAGLSTVDLLIVCLGIGALDSVMMAFHWWRARRPPQLPPTDRTE